MVVPKPRFSYVPILDNVMPLIVTPQRKRFFDASRRVGYKESSIIHWNSWYVNKKTSLVKCKSDGFAETPFEAPQVPSRHLVVVLSKRCKSYRVEGYSTS